MFKKSTNYSGSILHSYIAIIATCLGGCQLACTMWAIITILSKTIGALMHARLQKYTYYKTACQALYKATSIVQ